MNGVCHEIFLGYSFRSKIVDQANGDLYVIQMKDLVDDYSGIGNTLSKIDKESIKSKYLLKNGDVLFLSKGANNYASVYQDSMYPAISSSAFFVLRPKTDLINPFYLAWYINQERVQKYLADHKTGTSTLNVNRSAVENIPLEIPSLEKQRSIMLIANLQKREKDLVSLIQKRRQEIISEQLLTLTEEK